jgi:hypothetical protein
LVLTYDKGQIFHGCLSQPDNVKNIINNLIFVV